MKFARWTFGVAGVYGVLAILPLYFLESRIAQETPPAITHPEFFYGFVGLGLAWQLAFLCIASDPARYRLLMLPAVVEKFSFAIAAGVLYFNGRLAATMLGFGSLDALLGVLFLVGYVKTASSSITRGRDERELTARVGLESMARLATLLGLDAEIERLAVAKETAVARQEFQHAAWLRDRGDDLKKLKDSWPRDD